MKLRCTRTKRAGSRTGFAIVQRVRWLRPLFVLEPMAPARAAPALLQSARAQ